MHYIGNVFFELELEGKAGSNLKEAFEKNPFFKQLQFLPMLYLSSDDTLLVTYLPEEKQPGPKLRLIDDSIEPGILRSWGASDLISKWAHKNHLIYDMPKMECSKRINSKLWNFAKNRPIENAKIVYSAEEISSIIGDWVLKTDQGFAGRGHCVFNEHSLQKGIDFAEKEWKCDRGLILEPWVARLLDFSSQWHVSKTGKIKLVGLTRCLNTSSGMYLGTETGDDELVFKEYLEFVHQHVKYCYEYLHDIVKEGFYGSLGIDAMVYKAPESDRPTLYPVLEVNARMTMSAAILLYHQRQVKNKVTRIYYRNENLNRNGLLPNGYKRQLIID